MALATVFLGTPAAAVPTLDALLASQHEVRAVATAPDRPKGRGMALAASPVKQRALAAGLAVLQPPTLRDHAAQEALAELDADVFVVCAYGLILPAAVLAMPPLGCVNVHFSLLPLLRGAAPVAGAILAGMAESGVTIMQMDPGLDTGPILLQAAEPIGPDDDTGSLEARLAVLGARLLLDALDRLESGDLAARPQDSNASTYAAKLTPEDARIDWGREAPSIVDRVRAFSPRPGAWTTMEGRRLKVWRARRAEEPVPGPAGTFAQGAAGALLVAAGDGALTLEEVQPEGGRRMSGAEFLRGRRGVGGRFS